MTKAFVFGKFLPFHKGHEALIRFALKQCTFLTVLVCCSEKELLPDFIRKAWIENTFPESDNLEVKVFNYKESEFPNTSVSSTEVSQLWSAQFKRLFPDYSLVVTSEPYGEYVAHFMGIRHCIFDLERKQVPVSGSKIREDVYQNWAFLPEQVKPYYQKKVVLLGSESTGKTTLSEKLAAHFDATLVPEAARDLIQNSNHFSLDDLYLVAAEHAKRIEAGTKENRPLLIIDTDVHITQSYALFKFGKALDLREELYEANRADLYLYLTLDSPFDQDGTRLNESERLLLDLSHRKELAARRIRFHEISGDQDKRFRESVRLIEELLRHNGAEASSEIN